MTSQAFDPSTHCFLETRLPGFQPRDRRGGERLYKQAERRLWLGSTQRVLGLPLPKTEDRPRTTFSPKAMCKGQGSRLRDPGEVQCLELVVLTGERGCQRRKSQ